MNAPISRRIPAPRGQRDPLEALISLLSPSHARQLREVTDTSFRLRFQRTNERRLDRSDQKLLDDYVPKLRDAFYGRPWVSGFLVPRAAR